MTSSVIKIPKAQNQWFEVRCRCHIALYSIGAWKIVYGFNIHELVLFILDVDESYKHFPAKNYQRNLENIVFSFRQASSINITSKKECIAIIIALTDIMAKASVLEYYEIAGNIKVVLDELSA